MTRLSPDFPGAALASLDLDASTSIRTPRYANAYDADGRRTQLLLDEGEPLRLERPNHPADALIIAPAYHELTPGLPSWAPAIVSVNLQGILRTRDARDRVSCVAAPWTAVRPWVRPGAWYFLSEEDAADAPGLARQICAEGGHAVVTLGERGATLFEARKECVIAPFPAELVEPTGAGDCFAAAFIATLAEGRSVADAGRMAAAAGALAVEGAGLAAVPTREKVLARLERVAA